MLTRHGRRRLLPVSVVTALFAALLVSLPGPAAASTAPVLKSIAVTASAVTVPSEVEFTYAVADPASLRGISVTFKDVDGRTFVAGENIWEHSPLTGRISLSLRDGVRNGAYTAVSVNLLGPEGTSSVDHLRADTPVLAQADFSVSGSVEDREAPALSGLTVSPQLVRPGDVVTVSWAGVEEAHAFTGITFAARNNTFGHEWSSGAFPSTDGMSSSFQVRDNAYNGDYFLARVITSDDFDNTAVYRSDGTVTRTRNGLGPATHGLDLSSVKFTVVGSTRDVETPALTGFSVADTTLTAGDTVSVDYAATEDQPPLDAVEFQFRASDGQLVWLGDTGSPALTARLSSRVFSVGTHQLTKVVVVDRVGNRVEYLRDGTVVQGANRSTHSFDFKAADLIVKPSAPSILLARPKPRAVEVSWEQEGAQLPGISSYRVEVNPGGRVVTVPVNRSGESPIQKYTVTGLVYGVQYTFSITAQSGVGAGPTAVTRAIPRMSDRIFGVGDVSSDGRTDVIAFGPTVGTLGTVSAYLGNGRSGFSGKRTTMAREHVQRMAPGGDLYRDGNADYTFVGPNNDLEAHATNGRGGIAYRFLVGTGWGSMKFIDGGYDFSGDGISDVLGVAKNGNLYLYKGNGSGRLGSATRIGTGWGSMLAVMSAGDVNGDRFNDVVAVDSSGTMRLYKGNGKGGWRGTSTRIGSGWSGFGAVFPLRDFSGDRRPDIGAVTMNGDFHLYKGDGKGGFPSRTKIGHGWHNFF